MASSSPLPDPANSPVRRRRWNTLFKVGAPVLLSYLIYSELQKKGASGEVFTAFRQQLQVADWHWLWLTLLLVPANWLAEVQKWRPFVARYEPMPLWRGARAVLAGTSIALFTPNRVGEYGGRILFVQPENHWKALLVHFVGSLSQYVVLLAGGTMGALYLAGMIVEWGAPWPTLLPAAALLLLAGLVYVYFNIDLMVPLARRLPLLRRVEKYLRDLSVLENLDRRDLLLILLWSALRYGIYSTQYFLLLQFFGIKTGWTGGYAGIAFLYLAQTVLPLPALAGLAVRGGLAVFIWSYFGANEMASLAATFSLWIINVILPALLGTFSLISVNITKSLGYDDY